MTLISLFIANAIAHIISYISLRQAKAPNAMGVFAFFCINSIIAALLWQEVTWATWPALLFPIVGGLALLTTTIIRGKGKWIDYTILFLDIIIVYLAVQKFFI